MTCDVLVVHGLNREKYKNVQEKNAFILRLLKSQEVVL